MINFENTYDRGHHDAWVQNPLPPECRSEEYEKGLVDGLAEIEVAREAGTLPHYLTKESTGNRRTKNVYVAPESFNLQDSD